jgi:NADH-quinone oxidoreductase subunit J
MLLETIIIITLALLAIISAVVTITHKESVKSAIALVFHFFMLAGIYITLSAQFLAVMQIIVYAGAIMVLVLFVIMLLNITDDTEAQKRKSKIKQSFVITISVAMLILIFCFISFAYNSNPTDTSIIIGGDHGSVQAIGREIYSKFLFPLEIIGILLLSAIIGAVMLAKKKI